MNSRAIPMGHSIEFCVPAHFALRMLLAFSRPVNCVFWPIETLNWLVAASKLHKHRGTCYIYCDGGDEKYTVNILPVIFM